MKQLTINWSLEEQLHEDWKGKIDEIIVLPLPSQEYLVFTPTNDILIYSLCQSDWVSRPIEDYLKEQSK